MQWYLFLFPHDFWSYLVYQVIIAWIINIAK